MEIRPYEIPEDVAYERAGDIIFGNEQNKSRLINEEFRTFRDTRSRGSLVVFKDGKSLTQLLKCSSQTNEEYQICKATITGCIFDPQGGRIHADAYFNFLLMNGKKYLANLSFEPHPGAILVTQIQGVLGRSNELSSINWARALVSASREWSTQNSISELLILPSYRNTKLTASKNPLARLIYDLTAKREGFMLDKKRGAYVLKI